MLAPLCFGQRQLALLGVKSTRPGAQTCSLTQKLKPMFLRSAPRSSRHSGARTLHDQGQRSWRRLRAQEDAGSRTDEALVNHDRTRDPTGSKVAVTAVVVLLGIFIFPRLAMLSLMQVERTLVATLLSFEQAIASVGLTALRWAGSALLVLFCLSAAVSLFVSDEDLIRTNNFLDKKQHDLQRELEDLEKEVSGKDTIRKPEKRK